MRRRTLSARVDFGEVYEQRSCASLRMRTWRATTTTTTTTVRPRSVVRRSTLEIAQECTQGGRGSVEWRCGAISTHVCCHRCSLRCCSYLEPLQLASLPLCPLLTRCVSPPMLSVRAVREKS